MPLYSQQPRAKPTRRPAVFETYLPLLGRTINRKRSSLHTKFVGAGFSRSRAPQAPVRRKMPLRGTRPAKAGACSVHTGLSPTGSCLGPRNLVRISRRTVEIVRPERCDLVHVGIQHAEGGCIHASPW